MRTTISLVLVLALGAAAACAQSASQYQPTLHPPQMSALMQMLPAPSCPVRMELRQSFQFAPRFADQDTMAQGPAPRIRIVLSNLNSERVVKAKLVVVGWDTKAQLVPVAGTDSGSDAASGGMSRTVEADFAAGSDGSSTAVLALPGFSAVRRVQLQQVTFADGTTMDFASDENCQASPNPLVLVSAR